DELAESKTKALLDQAVREDWTFKRLTKFRQELESSAVEPTSEEKSRASKRKTPVRPYRRRGTKLYIDTAKLAELSVEQANALSAQLEKILEFLRSKTGQAPLARAPSASASSGVDGPATARLALSAVKGPS